MQELLPDLGFPEQQLTNPMTLLVDDRRNVTMECDYDRQEVVFSILLDALNQQFMAHTSMGLHRVLMEMTLLGARTAGAALGWSPECRCLVLWRRVANNFADAEAVAQILEDMLNVADMIEKTALEYSPVNDPRAIATPSTAGDSSTPGGSFNNWLAV